MPKNWDSVSNKHPPFNILTHTHTLFLTFTKVHMEEDNKDVFKIMLCCICNKLYILL